jgi:acyl-CoA thioesterase-1
MPFQTTARFIWPLFALVATITALSAPALAQQAKQKKKQPNPAFAPVTDDPGLPRVLLLGDSISIGYTPFVQSLLKGKANVHRPAANCQSTKQGLQQIDAWLGDGKWDVIHFNWGLHDLRYMGPNGEVRADPKLPTSKPQVPLDQYEKNLDQLVPRLSKTGAKLIWCATTPVPAGAEGRLESDVPKYNEAALRVMKKHGVAVNDLYSFALGRLQAIQRPANVHFTEEGSGELAAAVVKSIEQALAKK